MSASINDGERENELNQSINYDEIEELLSNDNEIEELMSNGYEINTESSITVTSLKSSDEKLISQQCRSSSCITQAQSTSLSMGKSSENKEENSSKSKMLTLTTKTSNIPGPVGLLPALVRLDFLNYFYLNII